MEGESSSQGVEYKIFLYAGEKILIVVKTKRVLKLKRYSIEDSSALLRIRVLVLLRILRDV